MTSSLSRRMLAEFVGTMWLVIGGCGSAIIAAGYPTLGIGFAGVALAFGLTVLTMAYAVGPISGCHLNPAVSVGLWAARRFPGKDLLPYIIAQVLGAIVAAFILYLIATGKPDFVAGGFASNGYGAQSPGHYGVTAVALTEFVLTGFFVFVIVGATDKRAPIGFAGLAIGLTLTLIHLVSIPIDNTSVNPARSTGPALFAGGEAIRQLWMFWLLPLAGGTFGGLAYHALFGEVESREPIIGTKTPAPL